MFKPLDSLLHSELRLAIVSLLTSSGIEMEFTDIKEKVNATPGNLSVQLQKLEAAGYIEIRKSFKKKYPLTTCRITDKGVKAFETYISNIKEYLNI